MPALYLLSSVLTADICGANIACGRLVSPAVVKRRVQLDAGIAVIAVLLLSSDWLAPSE